MLSWSSKFFSFSTSADVPLNVSAALCGLQPNTRTCWELCCHQTYRIHRKWWEGEISSELLCKPKPSASRSSLLTLWIFLKQMKQQHLRPVMYRSGKSLLNKRVPHLTHHMTVMLLQNLPFRSKRRGEQTILWLTKLICGGHWRWPPESPQVQSAIFPASYRRRNFWLMVQPE